MRYVAKQILYSFDVFFHFFSLEIPNLIQILSLTTILSLILKEHQVLINEIIGGTFWVYICQKSLAFLKEEIADPHSKSNRYEIKDSYKLAVWGLSLLIVFTLYVLFSAMILTSTKSN